MGKCETSALARLHEKSIALSEQATHAHYESFLIVL
jgi:hypothetical protein